MYYRGTFYSRHTGTKHQLVSEIKLREGKAPRKPSLTKSRLCALKRRMSYFFNMCGCDVCFGDMLWPPRVL